MVALVSLSIAKFALRPLQMVTNFANGSSAMLRFSYTFRLGCGLLLGTWLLLPASTGVRAEDSWNPFLKKDEPRKRRADTAKDQQPPAPALPPMDGVDTKPWNRPPTTDSVLPDDQTGRPPRRDPYALPGREPPPLDTVDRQPLPSERDRAVERSELAPILSGDGSGLPSELWQGVDARNVHSLVTRLDIPPRSPAVHALWKRLWTSSAQPPTQGPDRDRFEALRIEALYRSGLLKELIARLDADKAQAPQDPLYVALAARARVGAGDLKQGCADAIGLSRAKTTVPAAIKAEMLLVGGYCAAAEGNPAAASLAAELARAEGVDAPLTLAALDATASSQPFKPTLPKRLSLMDYRFLSQAKSIAYADALERAEPALLVALATDPAIEHTPARRVQAAELAARINALDAEGLAEVYRAQTFTAGDLAEPLSAKVDPAMRRALLFKALDGERTPMKRARAARAFLDDARRAGFPFTAAIMLATPIESLVAAQEIGWFAETAIEINIAAARYEQARSWVAFANQGERSGGLQHWLVLIDIADAKAPGRRGQDLVHAEQIAVRGRLAPDLMHRLATVLDALDYQIPIPLWEAASRTPQPTTGHLPETGVLSELQDASKKKEFARTLLLAMRALGSDGADRAHMIALGNAVRALKRAGLEADARRLALEAVFAGWPRMASN